jgi:hypothetical protein
MESCKLYHYPLSLFSIMVRYAIALGEQSSDSQMNIKETIIDLRRDENLSEWYLTTVNPKGQVRSIRVHIVRIMRHNLYIRSPP